MLLINDFGVLLFGDIPSKERDSNDKDDCGSSIGKGFRSMGG